MSSLASLLCLFIAATSGLADLQEECSHFKKVATCDLTPDPAAPFHVAGQVVFTQSQLCGFPTGNLNMTVTLTGFPADNGPGRLRGFHVHEHGNITGGCSSTGAHYNPYHVVHGGPDDNLRHVGDFGNIPVSAAGTVDYHFSDWKASILGIRTIIGRAMVVHSGTDDLGKGHNAESRKTGNAGTRLACCVIYDSSQ